MVPTTGVRGELVHNRRVDRHDARTARLAPNDCEMPDREVDVLAPQGESLAAAQPGRRKQTEERSIGVWWQRIDGLQGPRRIEQRGNLRWRVDVRLRSVVGATQQSGRRHLVTWIRRREVLREPAHCVDPPCGVLMPRSRCRQRPAYASIRRQRAIVAGRVEIPREKHKLVAGRAKPEPELAPSDPHNASPYARYACTCASQRPITRCTGLRLMMSPEPAKATQSPGASASRPSRRSAWCRSRDA